MTAELTREIINTRTELTEIEKRDLGVGRGATLSEPEKKGGAYIHRSSYTLPVGSCWYYLPYVQVLSREQGFVREVPQEKFYQPGEFYEVKLPSGLKIIVTAT